MQWRVMPTDEERKQPLGTSSTLSSRLLRLSSSPVAPSMRENISSLLFELSDKDATSFVQNIGLGFASGFLMTHNVPIPENAMEAWSSGSGNNNDNGANGESAINPITGQRLEAEHPVKMDPMTNEEKEREAEKLFVLFERLVFLGPFPARPRNERAGTSRTKKPDTHLRDTIPGSRRRASSTSRTPSNRLCIPVDLRNSTILTRLSTSTKLLISPCALSYPFHLDPISLSDLSSFLSSSLSSFLSSFHRRHIKAAQSTNLQINQSKSPWGATASDHSWNETGLGFSKRVGRVCEITHVAYRTCLQRS